MVGLRVRPICGALVCLAVLAFVSGVALAQLGPSAKGTSPVPATLRLAQVVPRLPNIHIYALARAEDGTPIPLGKGDKLSALVGSSTLPVEPRPYAGPYEGIAIVFLIDISGSISQQQFNLIKASVLQWIDRLQPRDQAAIVTLGSSVNTVQPFTPDRDKLKAAVAPLVSRDAKTLLYQGLVQAIDLSRRLDNNLPLRRAIVVLTDGLDDQEGGAGRQEVLDKLAVDPTPIYGIGAAPQYNAKVDAALKDFAGVVRTSGGEYSRGDIKDPNRAHDELYNIVKATQHFIVDDPTAVCGSCKPDGSPVVVRLELDREPVRLGSQPVTVRMVDLEGKVDRRPSQPIVTPPAPVTPPPIIREPTWFESIVAFVKKWWVVLAAAVAVIAGGSIAGIMLLRRKPGPDTLLQQAPTRILSEDIPTQPMKVPEIGLTLTGAIPLGTHQDKQRLRLYPIGRNDIGPFDILFEKTLAVGRSPDSEICISNDGQVSAKHCTLSPKEKSILVEDAGSRNGTRVNGVPINGFLHAEPDSILGVGRTEMRMNQVPVGAR